MTATDFTLTSAQVIDQAYKLPGVLSLSATVTANQAAQGLTVLNLMLKTLGTLPHLWLTTAGSEPLIAGQVQYPLPLVRRMMSVRRRISTGVNANDTPLAELSRQDYDYTPNKNATGTPVSYYFNPQVTTRTLYIWPTAATLVAASTTLEYTYQRVINDSDALNDVVDVPQEWLDCIVYNLAVRLARANGQADDQPRAFEDLKSEAARLLAVLSQDDQEDGSLYFQPSQY